jgi:hypothetical protein
MRTHIHASSGFEPTQVLERAQTLRALDLTTALIDRPLESVH